MNSPLRIGVTGGIGAGKSVVAKVFKTLGAPVYDADTRAKELMVCDPNLKSAILVLFGEKSYIDDQLNRKHIGDKAFHDPKLLNQLNALVHPAVKSDFDQWSSQQDSAQYIVKEAALLFESGSHKELDEVILVTANAETRVKRVLKRDTFRSKEDVLAIMKRQNADPNYEKLAHHVIRNDNEAMILPQLLNLHEHFLTKA